MYRPSVHHPERNASMTTIPGSSGLLGLVVFLLLALLGFLATA